jgi:hypothetical protein
MLIKPPTDCRRQLRLAAEKALLTEGSFVLFEDGRLGRFVPTVKFRFGDRTLKSSEGLQLSYPIMRAPQCLDFG